MYMVGSPLVQIRAMRYGNGMHVHVSEWGADKYGYSTPNHPRAHNVPSYMYPSSSIGIDSTLRSLPLSVTPLDTLP